MSPPLNFSPWPAPNYIAASSPTTVHLCCRRHGCPYHIDPMQELLFGHLIVSAYVRLPDVVAAQAIGGSEAVSQLMRSAGPLCCILGDERMLALQRQVPGVWALRN